MPFNSGDAPHHSSPPVNARQGAAGFQLPTSWRAELFAAEPDVQNPISMAWDGRGRLWVAENYTYAERGVKMDARLRDRVIVFEAGGTEGGFKRRQVFHADLQRLTSVEVGLGGVWLMCPPQLLFVPDANGDAVPDGPAEVVLDGFTVPDANHHNFANGLRFGPDGWLYGRCGASSPGELGVPGTPASERVPMRGTMWRFHPGRKVVEVLASGTTNPWGHDWDEHGELFFINTVNGHLWHAITGAHFRRAHTLDPNSHVYELIDQHADHWHFDTTRTWQQSRDGAANAQGGGHAHVGMMIYQGENWPPAYRGGLFTLNFHGRRVNHERIERRGAGFVGRHAPDLALSSDPWFRGIDLSTGPDGGVFMVDWSDTGECHNSTGVNRLSGRVYKLTFGIPEAVPVNLVDERGRDLAALQSSSNAWLARQARVELATRANTGHKLTHAIEDLRTLFAASEDVRVKLRALWTLHGLGAADREFLRALLSHVDERVRVWAVRLLTDEWPLDTTLSARPARPESRDVEEFRDFATMARDDKSALVRLALASALQRLPIGGPREAVAGGLVRHAEDAADHNLPLMIWYGLIPVGNNLPGNLVNLAAACELPTTRRLIARRLATQIEERPENFDALLLKAMSKPVAFRRDIVAGAAEAFVGWRRAKKPAVWDNFVARLESGGADAELLARIRELNVVFGDGRALADVKALALDAKAELPARRAALESLIEARPPDLREVCERLLRVRFLNPAAARGLALFDDPALGELIATAYSAFFHPSERSVAIDVLASRPSFARALLEYVGAGKIPRAEISAFHARQIRGFDDPALSKLLAEVWGEAREASRDKSAQMAQLKNAFSPAALARANKSAGRTTFEQLCAACHKLHGDGGALGPDLTGSNRNNLDYLLENIVDPSAVVTADFRNAIVRLKDGRMLNGFVAAQTSRTLTLRSMSDSQTIERADIGSIEVSKQSVMPEGLLEALNAEQQRDLIAYLMNPGQVAR